MTLADTSVADTYLNQWFAANKRYFPFGGARVTVHMALDGHPAHELRGLHELAMKLENSSDIVEEVDSWVESFIGYYNRWVRPPI